MAKFSENVRILVLKKARTISSAKKILYIKY